MKILVVGTSGSGKSFVADKISKEFGLKRIELDALHWEANWKAAPLEVFRARISGALEGVEDWVVDGNYSHSNDLFWPQADVFIWLDYSFTTTLWQVFSRSVWRLIRRELLWGNNRESFYTTFFTKESILWWMITTHKRRRAQFARAAQTVWPPRQILHIRNRKELSQKVPGSLCGTLRVPQREPGTFFLK